MSVKQKLKNPLIQQYLLEIALPIVGYFFFDWSMPIIAAFYFVDFFGSEIARNRRVYKVYKQDVKNNNLNYFFLSLSTGITLFAANLLWVWVCIQQIYPDRSKLLNELEAFTYEELWLLVPIVYFVYHFKDVLTFYMPRRFINYDYKKMAIYQMIELFILTFLVYIGVFIWQNFQMGDITVLIGFIVIKVGYDILVVRLFKTRYDLAQ